MVLPYLADPRHVHKNFLDTDSKKTPLGLGRVQGHLHFNYKHNKMDVFM